MATVMSTKMELDEGKVYFDVDYSEDELKIPNIHTYVFVGKDLHDGDNGDFYFQTSDCYIEHGPFFKVTDSNIKSELEIISMKEDLAEMLYTIESLQNLLKEKALKFSGTFGQVYEQ
jgi:hypothetical protein